MIRIDLPYNSLVNYLQFLKMKYTAYIILCLLLISVKSTGQCVEDSHSSFSNQGWLSCQQSESVIKERGKHHWIQYDLDQEYSIRDIRIWNHNVWGETGQGVKSIALDYSQDGKNWTSFGTLNVQKAPGSWKYIAPAAIELNGLTAKHILVSVLETWEANSGCAGIAELRLGVEATTPTDDEIISGDQFTVYPNPASDMIRLEFSDNEKREISIVNSIGQIVKTASAIKKSYLEISIWDLKEGLYFINSQSDKKIETNSFIKI